jgi:type I restriction enzyme S subunit
MKHAQTTWPEVAIEDFAEVVTGGTPSTAKSEYWKGGKIPWLNSGELNKRIITHADNFITEDGLKNSAAKMMPEDTVLVALTGATTGVSALLKMSACANQSVTGILPSKRHHPHFLFHYMQSIRHGIISDSYGGAQKHISQAYVKKLKVPLPPIDEQARIAILLDEADELRKLRVQADRRAGTLIPALFHGIFDNSDSRNWKEHSFGDSEILEIIDGDRGTNYPKKFDFREEGYCLFLNTSNVRKGSFDFSKCDFITHEKDNSLRKGKLIRGDVILTTRGTLGNSAYYDHSLKYENVRINSGMVILRPNTSILLPEYLLIILNSKEFTNQVTTMTSGSAQPQLPINRLAHIKFVLPPLPLQKEFVKQLTEIRELEAGQATSRTRLDALFQSMLHHAFNGEL